MDKNDILQLLKQKVFYSELPSKLDMSIKKGTLYITLDAEGILQNMQNDASAFEGWVFCAKTLIPNIEKVIVSWQAPVFAIDERVRTAQEMHYNRFLLRVVWFIENYSWVAASTEKEEELDTLRRRLTQLTLNFPIQNSKDKSEHGASDQKVKYEAMLETAVYQHLSENGWANHQLPMGLFDGAVSKATAITPGGASQADLWEIDKSDFCVYELKDCINSNNTHIGIISELMFYANVLHRLLITGEIHYPGETDKFRTTKRDKASRGFEHILDVIHDHSIKTVKAILLTDRLHPLLEHAKTPLLDIMNHNNAGIRYEHLTVMQLLPADKIPAPTYKEVQGARQIKVLQTQHCFNGVHGGGTWRVGIQNIQLPYIIEDGKETINLYSNIREDALGYFKKNCIAWWRGKDHPTGHMLSSQISCVNHLFPFMKQDETETLLEVLNSIQNRHRFVRVIPNPLDRQESNGNVCFEFVWKNRTLLDERAEKRGAMCTSIDAIIYAETSEHKRVLIPLEWKYVETYEHVRASQASLNRYISRVGDDSNIKEWLKVYEYYPLYELVRQTLLMEEIIKSHDKVLPVDDYLHINVIPEGNIELRTEVYRFAEGLKDRGKYLIISPKQLMEPYKERCRELYDYLDMRYWQ